MTLDGNDQILDPDLKCESPILMDILQFWKGACGDQSMPARHDINLLDLPVYQQPHILLLDVEPKPRLRLRWRFIGTHITVVMNRNVAGLYADEIYDQEQLAAFCLRTDWVLQHGLPLRSNARSADLNSDVNEVIFLPLSDNGVDIDQILMAAVYRTEHESEAVPGSAEDEFGA